ncbi:MAG: hypothetical protein ACO20H_02395 [Bacteriovoracaceae bacterium]
MIEENKIISEALRLLIPEEINDLTDEFVAFNKVTLTSLLENELGLNTEKESELKELRQEKVEAPKKVQSQEKLVDEGVDEAISTFVLAQRNKLKESNLKLKEKGIQDLYKVNANKELKKASPSHEEQKDEKSSGQAGILIDKDHF